MINVCYKEIDKMWYGVAIEGEEIIATTFSPSEEEVLRSLLESLPYDAPFQMAEKPSRFSTNVLETMKAIFDGKDVPAKFKLAINHLPTYMRRMRMEPINKYQEYLDMRAPCSLNMFFPHLESNAGNGRSCLLRVAFRPPIFREFSKLAFILALMEIY